MKNQKIIFKWFGVASIVALIAFTCRVTLIPDEVLETTLNPKGEMVAGVKITKMEQFCLENWDAKIVPTVKERAKNMPQFLSDVKVDLNAAGQSYGNRANETSAWSFCVSGSAKVIGIENPDKPNKQQLLLDVAPFDGTADIKLFYGKVFSSNIKNAIRDGVGYLHLDDFTNQVEFADLTTALNNKVKNDIFPQHAPTSLLNKEVDFFGCISLIDTAFDNLVVIPVELTVKGG